MVEGDCVGNVDAGESGVETAEAEVDVFEIGFELFGEAVESVESVAAKEAGGAGGYRDGLGVLGR